MRNDHLESRMSKFAWATIIMTVYTVVLALYLNSCSVQLKVDELQRKVKNNIEELDLVHQQCLRLEKELDREREGRAKDLKQTLEQKFQEQQDGFDQKLQEQQDGFDQKLRQQQQRFDQKLQEQPDQQSQENTVKREDEKHIDQSKDNLQQQVNDLLQHTGIPPHTITTLCNYQQEKARNSFIETPPLYTHPGGYRYKLRIFPNGVEGGYGTHLSVVTISLVGEHDKSLKFPAKHIITVQILSQQRVEKNYTKDIEHTVYIARKNEQFFGGDFKFISHSMLGMYYIKNDCIKIAITKVLVQ